MLKPELIYSVGNIDYTLNYDTFSHLALRLIHQPPRL